MFSPLQVLVLCCHSKLQLLQRISRNNLTHFVLLRFGPYPPAVSTLQRTTAGTEVLIDFRRVPMLSIFMYSQCLCIYLHLNSQQRLQVIYSRGRPGNRPLRCLPLHIHRARKRSSSHDHGVGSILCFTCLLTAPTWGHVLTLH